MGGDGGGEAPASPPRRVLAPIALITAVLLASAPHPAAANAGLPSYGGVPVGEVRGLDGIGIVSETLAIDLRPVDERTVVEGESVFMSDGSGATASLGGSPIVTATYHLVNDGKSRTVNLLFAHGAERVRDFHVEIDGQFIGGVRSEDRLPANWRAPRYTPGPNGPDEFLYNDSFTGETIAPRPSSFLAAVPAGASRLTVGYRADAGTYLAESLIVRQFAYILAPALSWARFGHLNVVVYVPHGWRAWSAPALERQGDRLVGRFTGVPADALALSVQPAESTARIAARWLSLGLLALTLLAGGPICWRIGRRRRRRWPRRLAVGALCGIAWAAAIGLAGWLAVAAPDAVTPAAYISHYGYGLVMAVIGIAGLASLAVPVGLALSWIGDRMAPTASAAPPPPPDATSPGPGTA